MIQYIIRPSIYFILTDFILNVIDYWLLVLLVSTTSDGSPSPIDPSMMILRTNKETTITTITQSLFDNNSIDNNIDNKYHH